MRAVSVGLPRIVTCIAAVVLLLGSGDARLLGQASEGDAPTWTEVIDRYLAGDYVGSTALLDRVVGSASTSETSRTVNDLRQAVVSSTRGQAEHQLAVRRLKAAALVPLEALLPLSVRVAHDARFASLEALLSQALLAIRGLEKASKSGGRDLSRFRQGAEVGYMQFLLNTGKLEDVERVAGGLRLPEHAGDLQVQHDLLRGMVRERVARLATGGRATGYTHIGGEAAAGPMGPVTSPAHAGGVSIRTGRDALARRYWTSAARWYERVLDARPRDPEARLHLARTWLDRDAPERALELLRPLASEPCATAICSLALLFSGEAHQRLGATEAASQAYLHASSDPRTRQSALLALVHLSLLRNDGAGLPLALQLRDGAPLAHEIEPDAWGIYVGGRRANIDVVLAPLRLAVRR